LLLLNLAGHALAQQTVVRGRVTDAETGEAMPFVNVFFVGSTIGQSTDFEGYFEIRTDRPTDSLAASSLGYQTMQKPVRKGRAQQVDFQLMPDATTLEAVEVVYGEYENPAWEVMRKVVAHKPQHDQRKLSAYEHESYTKIEVDVDNITEKFRKKKVVRKITAVLDSIDRLAGEDGKPVLPIFISETLSDFYYRKSPERKKEYIKKSKVTGVAVTDGSTVSQLIGSSFQQYNFYKNWMSIVDKDFVSPIADGWKSFYEYDLALQPDTIAGFACHRIAFKPKRPEDLAFSGTMWITDSTYALKQIEVSVGKRANLNFIEKIKIQQQYAQVGEGTAWLPEKTRVLLDIGQIRDDWAGMLAKFYISNRDFQVNEPKPLAFFDQELQLDPMALQSGEGDWERYRHEPLSPTEQNVYLMIDTLKKLPMIKTYVELANILLYGYKSVGKVDVGPYLYAYSYNNIEGHRLRMGFKTNAGFSKKLELNGYAAYGFADERMKYRLGFRYIPSRSPWTVISASRRRDIDQVGIFSYNMADEALFNAFVRFGTLRRPFLHTINQASIQTDITNGFTQKLTFQQRDFEPLYPFQYFTGANEVARAGTFSVTEMMLEARLAIGEQFLINDNDRVSLGNGNKPIVTFRYTYSPQGLLSSDFSYQRFDLKLEQDFRLGALGNTFYALSGGYIPSTVPYPLLEAHLGNESAFYNEDAFNMMNFFEFVSDRFASLSVMHRFDGLLMNRLPLMRKLKWRLFGSAKVLYGDLSAANREIIPEINEKGIPLPGFRGLGEEPYVEVGYGIENIFRFIRVDFLHRLTYRNTTEGGSDFGIRISTQFRL